MEEKDYTKVFEYLGINVVPLDDNYSPDEYGKKLMASGLNVADVSYAATTLTDNSKQK